MIFLKKITFNLKGKLDFFVKFIFPLTQNKEKLLIQVPFQYFALVSFQNSISNNNES